MSEQDELDVCTDCPNETGLTKCTVCKNPVCENCRDDLGVCFVCDEALSSAEVEQEDFDEDDLDD